MNPLIQHSTLWCIGRNYIDHALELKNPMPEEPIVFLKPGACICPANGLLPLPFEWGPIHHEVELALQLGDNLDIVAATIALDLTARDLQNELKKKGLPWTAAKAFKNACALGPWQPVESISELESLEITLHVNGVLRQKGCLANLIFPVDQLINYLRHRYPMRSGDLILTGTPAGVGPIYPGDRLRAEASNGVKCEWIVESI